LSHCEDVLQAYQKVSDHVNCYCNPSKEDPLFQEMRRDHTTLLVNLQRYLAKALGLRVRVNDEGDVDFWDERMTKKWAENYTHDPIPFV